MLINTEFDGTLEEDVAFEETDNSANTKETLKNAENILKSFLYMKKMFASTNPFINPIVKVETIDTTTGKKRYFLQEETSMLLIKNIDGTHDYSFFYNGGEFVLFPYEVIELPVENTSVIETLGKFSMIESKYGL